MSEQHGIDDPYHGHSFVVRIWWEKGHDDQALWRGWVQHAITGKSRYFDHVADMLMVIFEGAFVLSQTLEDPSVVAAQLRQYRNYLELIFAVEESP